MGNVDTFSPFGSLTRTTLHNFSMIYDQGIFISFAIQNPCRPLICTCSCVLKSDKVEGAFKGKIFGFFMLLNEHHLNPKVFINKILNKIKIKEF